MNDVDLSLISIDDLLKEVESRTDTFICAMKFSEADEKGREIRVKFGQGSWLTAVGMAAVLQNDCLNDWPEEGVDV